MASHYFRFDFKGRQGTRDNSYLSIKHESPHAGEVTVAISSKEKGSGEALENISQLSQAMGKKSHTYRWSYQDAIMIETEGFDPGLGVFVTSNLEKRKMVPQGSVVKLRRTLKEAGHELQEDNISLMKKFAPGMEERQAAPDEKEKQKLGKKLLKIFRFRKNRGRGI